MFCSILKYQKNFILGIRILGANITLSFNLVLHTLFRGTFNNRYEDALLTFDGAIEVQGSILPVLIGNTVAGSERAGYRIDGEGCPGSELEGYVSNWIDNTVHSTLIGVEILPGNSI